MVIFFVLLSFLIFSIGMLHGHLSKQTLSFLLLGDWGKGGTDGTVSGRRLLDLTPINTDRISIEEHSDKKKKTLQQMQIATAMGSFSASANPQPSFVVALGDNFYNDGVKSSTDTMWDYLWKDVYLGFDELNIPWYPVFGNHDYGNGATGVNAQIHRYHDHTDDDIWIFPSTNYTKRFNIPGTGGSVCIVFIDTTTLAPSVNRCCNEEGGVSTSEQERRINNQLYHIEKALQEAADDPPTWLLVAGHYPVYSASSNGDVSELIQYLLPLMQQYNVHAYLCGHDHIGEHMQHPDYSTEFFVVGAGSMTDTADEDASEATLLWAGQSYASFADMRATVSELTISYRDVNGTVRYSYSLDNPNAVSVGGAGGGGGLPGWLHWSFWSSTASQASESKVAMASGGAAMLALVLFCGYSMYRQRVLSKGKVARVKFLDKVRSKHSMSMHSLQSTPTFTTVKCSGPYVELMELGEADASERAGDQSGFFDSEEEEHLSEEDEDVVIREKLAAAYSHLNRDTSQNTTAATSDSTPSDSNVRHNSTSTASSDVNDSAVTVDSLQSAKASPRSTRRLRRSPSGRLLPRSDCEGSPSTESFPAHDHTRSLSHASAMAHLPCTESCPDYGGGEERVVASTGTNLSAAGILYVPAYQPSERELNPPYSSATSSPARSAECLSELTRSPASSQHDLPSATHSRHSSSDSHIFTAARLRHNSANTHTFRAHSRHNSGSSHTLSTGHYSGNSHIVSAGHSPSSSANSGVVHQAILAAALSSANVQNPDSSECSWLESHSHHASSSLPSPPPPSPQSRSHSRNSSNGSIIRGHPPPAHGCPPTGAFWSRPRRQSSPRNRRAGTALCYLVFGDFPAFDSSQQPHPQ